MLFYSLLDCTNAGTVLMQCISALNNTTVSILHLFWMPAEAFPFLIRLNAFEIIYRNTVYVLRRLLICVLTIMAKKKALFLCYRIHKWIIPATKASTDGGVARPLPVRWKTDLKPMPKWPTLSGSLCLMLWDSIRMPRQSSSSNRALLYAYRAGPWFRHAHTFDWINSWCYTIP